MWLRISRHHFLHAGRLGRKTKAGWFDYNEKGSKVDQGADAEVTATAATMTMSAVVVLQRGPLCGMCTAAAPCSASDGVCERSV